MKYFDLIEAARPWYDFNWQSRHYHNWGHACKVVENVHKILPDPSEELVLAAYWHDAVYVPGAGSDANERCSAAALGVAARGGVTASSSADLKNSAATVVNAQQLILYTKVETHLNDRTLVGDIAVLLDSDLGSLAAPYNDFLRLQDDIIAENGGTIAANQRESANFLHNFLTCRKYIYHTDYGREHWEKLARANIAKYCNES